MADNKNPADKFWNGKNIAGGSSVGDKDLISAGPRTGKTLAKYEVSNATVAADNLQKGSQ